MAPNTTPSSGNASPNLSVLDAPLASAVHPTAARRPLDAVTVQGENTIYTDEHITSKFYNRGADVVVQEGGRYVIAPTVTPFELRTQRKVPRTGYVASSRVSPTFDTQNFSSLMLVGIGGNNGTTLVATSTIRLGLDATGKDVYAPLSDLLPMVHPNDLVLGGWDISGLPLDAAMKRAAVLEWDLQRQVAPYMQQLGAPLPSIYYPDYIAANQEERADNVIPGTDKAIHLEQIRKDIRDFKAANNLDQVIVFWTANTERYSEIIPGVNDTAEAILASIGRSHEEIAPSTVFAIASILEGAPFINGAPQNTFVPGVIELAEQRKSFIGGDDLKSGQTKLKSVLAEFLVNAGIKPLSIASYNHLGNNDGRNLSSQRQFRSKEISKSSVVDDMVAANRLLYKTKPEVEAEQGTARPLNPVRLRTHVDSSGFYW